MKGFIEVHTEEEGHELSVNVAKIFGFYPFSREDNTEGCELLFCGEAFYEGETIEPFFGEQKCYLDCRESYDEIKRLIQEATE